MKLAELLILRVDLQKNIENLKERLKRCLVVFKGEEPIEDPENILKLLNEHIIKLESTIKQINKTNSYTTVDGVSISDLIAKRDVIGIRLNILRGCINGAVARDRYSLDETRVKVPTINIVEKQAEIDRLSKEYRMIDTKIQGLNWTTDIIK